jgi:hypothetical protein
MGIDYFVQSGFGVWFHRAFSAGNFDGFDGRGYGMVAGFVLVGIFGAALQLSHADRDGK